MSDLILKDVSFSYPGGFLAVDHINMEIKSGENVAIVGQNGAGKTTTVKMMNGLLKPTEGDVLIGDMNTKDYTTAQVSRVVGYVFQNPDDHLRSGKTSNSHLCKERTKCKWAIFLQLIKALSRVLIKSTAMTKSWLTKNTI